MKYYGEITSELDLVNKGYVDKEIADLSQVAKTGEFTDLNGFKKLTIGDIEFDGTQEKTIPIYNGSINDPNVIYPEIVLAPQVRTMTLEQPTYQMKLE